MKNIKTKARANTSAIKAPPIEWDKFKDMDKLVVETLKDRVRDLTLQLEARSDSVKTTSLVKYLEREAEKQAFEIKYLKSKLQLQEKEVKELTAQNTYLHKELLENYEKNRTQSRNVILQQATFLAETCRKESQSIEEMLEFFDPAKVLDKSTPVPPAPT